MRRIRSLSLFLLLSLTLLAFLFVSCGQEDEKSVAESEAEESTPAADKIAYICSPKDGKGIDDSDINESVYEGIREFVSDNELTEGEDCFFILPSDESYEAVYSSIEEAVNRGAYIVIAAGEIFDLPLYDAQDAFPETKFVLLDSLIHNEDMNDTAIGSNSSCILYKEEEAGFLAGYAALADGKTKLGFFGENKEEETLAYAYGFIQGAEAAANNLGLPDGGVSINVQIEDLSDKDDEAKEAALETAGSLALELYKEGLELIFCPGDELSKRIVLSAEEANGLVILSGCDKRYLSSSVVTTALKDYARSSKILLESVKDGSFDTYFSSTFRYLGASTGGIGLSTKVRDESSENAFDRFTTFNREEYDIICEKLASGEIVPAEKVYSEVPNALPTLDDIKEAFALNKVVLEHR